MGLALIAALALFAGGTRVGWRALRQPIGAVPDHGWERARSGFAYETSRTCEPCHPVHQASWARTHHAQMTQVPTPDTIVAPFDGRRVVIQGVESVPSRRGDDFFITSENPATGQREEMKVALVTGSRRQQQFHVRSGDRLVRLPLAWSIVEQRWLNLSEAFFHPDGSPFSQHASVWDLNCIFCHSVKARPGIKPDGGMSSSVAELGIACEACHGPGEEHARRMRSPLRRMAFNSTEGLLGDPALVNPARLSPKQSVQVCGHCHGNRVPTRVEDIRRIFATGDPFTPGEELSRTWLPITRETSVEGVTFAHRFWPDGSPRLTAYEYQGLRGSKCFTLGSMTCLTCHSMHDSDPAGQIITGLDVQDACVRCHPTLGGAGLTEHAHHEPTSTGSRCVSCHMPPMIYGIMSWHPSHLVSSPDPLSAARAKTPDACTLCHAGRSRAWAIASKRKLWGGDDEPTSDELTRWGDVPEMARLSVSGDCMSRALAAWRLGEPGAPEAEVTRLAIPFLSELLVDDYPAVRRTAAQSLRQLTNRTDIPHAFDSLEARQLLRLELGTVDATWFQQARAEREESPVGIGE